MTEYVNLAGGTIEDFCALACRELGRPIDLSSGLSLLQLVTHLHDPLTETVSGSPSSPRRLRVQIGQTRYVVNIKRALLVAAATLLDTHGAGGAANASLMLSGYGTKAIARLDQQQGQLCNYMVIVQNEHDEPYQPLQLMELTYGKPCKFPSHHCQHMASGICEVTTEAVRKNIEGMLQERVLIIDRNGKVSREM